MTLLRNIAILGCCLLGACDSENVYWAFVSDPDGSSTGSGGGLIVVVRTSSTAQMTSEERVLRIVGSDRRGAVTVMLPTHADLACLQRADSHELRSPLLEPKRVEFTGGSVTTPTEGPVALTIVLPDASILHPAMVGVGTLHVASQGSLLVLESGSGLVLFGEMEQPELLPANVSLSTVGPSLDLILPDGRVRRLQSPPSPTLAERLVENSTRQSYRILGPRGEALAELPAATVTLHYGDAGLFCTASLPDGLPGDPVPMSLAMATHNRYLLRIEEPR